MKKTQTHRIPTALWTEFQASVIALDDNPGRRELLALILEWIRKSPKIFDAEPFASYGLGNFAKLHEDEMPVEHSAFVMDDVKHFKETVSRYDARKSDSIARFIRDTLEDLITIEVDRQCPNCRSDFMLAFTGRQKMSLAFVCKICGHSHYSDGSPIVADTLDYASTEYLRQAGLIQ
ncbi:hypothetical protein [Cupriavidus sp. BIS7]|uniref:hypothetical protein n=1 Tax=Cupriavidus sp. BIS7 TaxID=1217718 RepID=UPI0012F6D1C1|nr:hypothetical protein [Cupriavidus sp. BIS7]